jgi:hypothetical protein
MMTYSQLFKGYEIASSEATQNKVLQKIIEKVDDAMDQGHTSEFILNSMMDGKFPKLIARDIIKEVERDRAKRTNLGKLLYE